MCLCKIIIHCNIDALFTMASEMRRWVAVSSDDLPSNTYRWWNCGQCRWRAIQYYADLGVVLTEVVPPLYHLAPRTGDPSMEAAGHMFHGCNITWVDMLPGSMHGLEFYNDDGKERWFSLETTPGLDGATAVQEQEL